MICPSCGKNAPDIAAFCSACGTMLNQVVNQANETSGINHDEALAVAEQGNANMQTHLADMYYTRQNTAEDCDKSLYWDEKAARQGDESTKESLSAMNNNTIDAGDDSKSPVFAENTGKTSSYKKPGLYFSAILVIVAFFLIYFSSDLNIASDKKTTEVAVVPANHPQNKVPADQPVRREDTEPVSGQAALKDKIIGYITENDVRFRINPNTTEKEKGFLQLNNQIEILGEQQADNTTWYHVELSTGERGYVAARFVSQEPVDILKIQQEERVPAARPSPAPMPQPRATKVQNTPEAPPQGYKSWDEYYDAVVQEQRKKYNTLVEEGKKKK